MNEEWSLLAASKRTAEGISSTTHRNSQATTLISAGIRLVTVTSRKPQRFLSASETTPARQPLPIKLSLLHVQRPITSAVQEFGSTKAATSVTRQSNASANPDQCTSRSCRSATGLRQTVPPGDKTHSTRGIKACSADPWAPIVLTTAPITRAWEGYKGNLSPGGTPLK